MCGNRVEELEARVNELEASVEGLTDELVECKVRLRELENTVDEDNGFAADESRSQSRPPGESDTQPTSEAEPADSTKQADGNDNDNREESEAESESDIIVA
jgi:uncharacterized coiled-coil protein SlyX